ncbi:MAG: CHASE domain-containing protein [Mesorhizobium sp.]
MKKIHPIAAFVAVALISLAMAGYACFATQEAARIKFVAAVNDAQDRIESRMELHLSLLRATKALFESQDGDVSPSEYAAFYKALDVSDHFAGLHGIGFIRVVKAGEEAAVERELTDNLGSDRKVHPPSSLPQRAITVLVEPHDGYSDPVIGFDMMVDPARREAIEQALDDNGVHATGRVLMGDKTGASRNFAGFLVFTRLTRQAASDLPGTGLVYNAFRAEDLFQTALAKTPLLPVSVEVYDGDVGDDSLMFRSETPPSSPLAESLATVRKFTMAGRQWTVLFRPTSAFASPSSRAVPLLLGLFGLLLAGAIALFLRYQQKALEAASTLHETTEKSLLEKELMLQEMKHRIKNSIARVLAIARQTAAQADDIGQFSSSFSARLQAMAASQDMLTRSRWQKADLGDLLRIELGQVFGKELPEDLLDGPQVLLDETTTQALGLTFHELATNALKYGKVGSLVSSLRIRWRLEGRSRSRALALDWHETGQADLQSPSGTGFGTKLIDLNIVRELGGEISRDYRPDGLKVRIRIPLPGSPAV